MDWTIATFIGLIGLALSFLNGMYMKHKGYSFGRSFLLTLIAVCMLGMTINGIINK